MMSGCIHQTVCVQPGDMEQLLDTVKTLETIKGSLRCRFCFLRITSYCCNVGVLHAHTLMKQDNYATVLWTELSKTGVRARYEMLVPVSSFAPAVMRIN